MNERIKQLAEQAGIKINEGQETHLWWLERFAELVRQDEREVNKALAEALEMLVQSGWSKAFIRYEYDSDEPEENLQRDLVMSLIAKARRTE